MRLIINYSHIFVKMKKKFKSNFVFAKLEVDFFQEGSEIYRRENKESL